MVKEKIKKEKMPSKICNLCGDTTSEYLVFQNAPICKKCQKSERFVKIGGTNG